MAEIHDGQPSASNAAMHQAAREIESANPLWLVIFGDYTRQFVAFSRFSVPRRNTMIVASDSGALVTKMRDVERESHGYPAERVAC